MYRQMYSYVSMSSGTTDQIYPYVIEKAEVPNVSNPDVRSIDEVKQVTVDLHTNETTSRSLLTTMNGVATVLAKTYSMADSAHEYFEEAVCSLVKIVTLLY